MKLDFHPFIIKPDLQGLLIFAQEQQALPLQGLLPASALGPNLSRSQRLLTPGSLLQACLAISLLCCHVCIPCSFKDQSEWTHLQELRQDVATRAAGLQAL